MSFLEILISNWGIFWIKTGIQTEQFFKHLAYTCWLRESWRIKAICVLKSAQNIKHAWCPPVGWNHRLMLNNCSLCSYSTWTLTGQNLETASDFQQLASTPPVWKSGQKSCPPKCFFSRLAYFFNGSTPFFSTPGVWRGAKHLFNLFWTLHTSHLFC